MLEQYSNLMGRYQQPIQNTKSTVTTTTTTTTSTTSTSPTIDTTIEGIQPGPSTDQRSHLQQQPQVPYPPHQEVRYFIEFSRNFPRDLLFRLDVSV